MDAHARSGAAQSADAPLAERPRLTLICRAGSSVFALPIEHVVETLRPLPIEPIGEAPAFVQGLAILRGQVVPVIDAALLLGGQAPAPPGRFVAVRVGERCAALAVSAVVGLRSLSSASLGALPPLLREAGADLVAWVGNLDGELLFVLSSLRLVPESLWAQLDAAAP